MILDSWWYLIVFDDIWLYPMILDDICWLIIFDCIWYVIICVSNLWYLMIQYLMRSHDISIHVIICRDILGYFMVQANDKVVFFFLNWRIVLRESKSGKSSLFSFPRAECRILQHPCFFDWIYYKCSVYMRNWASHGVT